MASKRGRTTLIAILVILIVFLCAIAAGTYWAIGPALRCHRPQEGPIEPGWSARVLTSDGRDRCYYIYAPKTHDPTEPVPLVFSFHGFLSNPASQALISGWHQLADEDGFLVAYPQGTGFPQRWNTGYTWGGGDVDDVQFFRDMLDDLTAQAAVDRARIYVNGFSNGGGMTVRIGCDAADRVTAIGSVAGAIVAKEDCSPSRPIPALAFHGTADPIVAYEGGEMERRSFRRAAEATNAPTYFWGAEEWVALWAQGNGCSSELQTIPPQGDVSGVRYVGCDQKAQVALYTIDRGGHTWPGGFPIPVVGKTTRHVDATEEMWRFFQLYRPEDPP